MGKRWERSKVWIYGFMAWGLIVALLVPDILLVVQRLDGVCTFPSLDRCRNTTSMS
jgi:hypothetical protein